jgi:MbtH protein
MSWDESDDSALFQAVINHEEQYSIWPMEQELPNGWKPAGKQGTKKECLAWINEVWTDMRPRSLREKLGNAPEGSSHT